MSAEFVAQQQRIGDDEAQRENLRRREPALEQHLRKHKGAAPDGHHYKRHKVIFQSMY